MDLLHQQHHRRAHDRLLRDTVHAGLPGHPESQPGEGLQGEPCLFRRGVHGVGDQEHHRLRGRGNRRSAAGCRYANVENRPNERSTDDTDPVHGCLERSHWSEETVHAVADHRRVSQQRQHAPLHVFLSRGAHGGHRCLRGSVAGVDRWLVHHVHGCFQLHRGHHDHRIEDASDRCRQRFSIARCADRDGFVRDIVLEAGLLRCF